MLSAFSRPSNAIDPLPSSAFCRPARWRVAHERGGATCVCNMETEEFFEKVPELPPRPPAMEDPTDWVEERRGDFVQWFNPRLGIVSTMRPPVLAQLPLGMPSAWVLSSDARSPFYVHNYTREAVRRRPLSERTSIGGLSLPAQVGTMADASETRMGKKLVPVNSHIIELNKTNVGAGRGKGGGWGG